MPRHALAVAVVVAAPWALAAEDCRRSDVWVKWNAEWSYHMGSCKTLDLSRSPEVIGPNGAAALAESGFGASAVEKLWMQSSNVQDAGAIALAAVLPSVKALTKLNLRNNQITDVGAAALAEALKRQYPPVTKQLFLDHNSVSSALIESINATLKASAQERTAGVVAALRVDAEACKCNTPECRKQAAAQAAAAYGGGASRLERFALGGALLGLVFVSVLWCGERSRTGKLVSKDE